MVIWFRCSLWLRERSRTWTLCNIVLQVVPGRLDPCTAHGASATVVQALYDALPVHGGTPGWMVQSQSACFNQCSVCTHCSKPSCEAGSPGSHLVQGELQNKKLYFFPKAMSNACCLHWERYLQITGSLHMGHSVVLASSPWVMVRSLWYVQSCRSSSYTLPDAAGSRGLRGGHTHRELVLGVRLPVNTL